MATNTSHTLTVKVTFGGSIRKFILLPADGVGSSSPVSSAFSYRWSDLEANIKSVHGIAQGTSLFVTYLDEDGDPVTLSSDRELNDLIALQISGPSVSSSKPGPHLITLKFDASVPANPQPIPPAPQVVPQPPQLDLSRLSITRLPPTTEHGAAVPTSRNPVPISLHNQTSMDMDITAPPPSEIRVGGRDALPDEPANAIPVGRPASRMSISESTPSEKAGPTNSVTSSIGTTISSPNEHFFNELADLVAQHKWVFDAEPELMDQVHEFAQQVMSSGATTSVSLDTARKQLESFADQLRARQQNPEQEPQSTETSPPPNTATVVGPVCPTVDARGCAEGIVRAISARAVDIAQTISSSIASLQPQPPNSDQIPLQAQGAAGHTDQERNSQAAMPPFAAQWSAQWNTWAQYAAAAAAAARDAHSQAHADRAFAHLHHTKDWSNPHAHHHHFQVGAATGVSSWAQAGPGRRVDDGEVDSHGSTAGSWSTPIPGAFPVQNGTAYELSQLQQGGGPQTTFTPGASACGSRRGGRHERRLDRRVDRMDRERERAEAARERAEVARERVERERERVERGRAAWVLEREREKERERSRRRGDINACESDPDRLDHGTEDAVGREVPGGFPPAEMSEPTTNQLHPASPHSSTSYAEAVQALESMGFRANPRGPSLPELLESYGGRVERVVEALLRDAEVDEIMDGVVVME
ncbi:hypothetical protein HDU93_004341 [Gonapodya sp. JEL0774]|nr:hypothetical protein HDU93_004341 [Gonapodya sp. JEL0774]